MTADVQGAVGNVLDGRVGEGDGDPGVARSLGERGGEAGQHFVDVIGAAERFGDVGEGAELGALALLALGIEHVADQVGKKRTDGGDEVDLLSGEAIGPGAADDEDFGVAFVAGEEGSRMGGGDARFERLRIEDHTVGDGKEPARAARVGRTFAPDEPVPALLDFV
ncbi:MAG: hypothetical protein M5U18_10270 [Dehalococcoidia bacterium]|nr:hypothetical protein [Dehalococcoidia bacterium]